MFPQLLVWRIRCWQTIDFIMNYFPFIECYGMFESIILTGPRDDGSDTAVHINQPSPIISKAVNSWPWNQALSKIKRPTIIPIHELSINALHQMSLSAFCISWNTCALQNLTYERMLEQERFDNRNITLVKRIWSCKIWDEDELQQKYILSHCLKSVILAEIEVKPS